MIFNYKRVSTTDQNTERQLLDISCDREYVEKISGKDTNRLDFYFDNNFLSLSLSKTIALLRTLCPKLHKP